MADPRERDQTEELPARAAAAISRSKDLSERVSEIAAKVADTEDKVADVHEHLAGNPAAAVALAHAARARSFAAHERQEQQRWGTAERD
jgi:predicted transcriptional regulator